MTTNNNNNCNNLIDQLCSDLEPMKPCRHPLSCATTWFFAGFFAILIVSSLVGFRMDLMEKLQSFEFLVEVFAILTLSFTAALASAYLGIPDGARHKQIMILPYIVISVALLLGLKEVVHHGFHMPVFELHHCVMDALIMGGLPIIFMLLMMRDQKTTKPVLTSVVNAIAAGSIGYLGLRLTCASDAAGHVCIYHILPFLVFGIFLGLIARRLYRW